MFAFFCLFRVERMGEWENGVLWVLWVLYGMYVIGEGKGGIYFWNLSKKSGRVGGCFDVCSCVDGGGGGDFVVDEEEDEEDENENGVRDEWDEGSEAEDVVDMVDLMEFVCGGGG